LNQEAWVYFLRDYPDADFVCSLLHIIDFGANIGFDGDCTASYTANNLKSASQFPQTVSAAIEKELSKGRLAGPFSSPPFPHFHSSLLGMAICKHSGKQCQIHHLSWPHDSSVNDGIPDAQASIVYDRFQAAVKDLVISGHGSLMIKSDLELAFHHIPIQAEDQPLLGFKWEGKFYYELFLMFGLWSAPYIFNLFSEALHWILAHYLPAFIHHYLDGFLKIF
jgi:hypothetical protein